MLLSTIKDKIYNNRELLTNFSYLSILQIFNLFIPFLTYPYLIRVLGSELYGLIIFTQVIAGYFNIFISFGFALFGAKEVSIHRANKTKLSEIISVITFIKFVFFIISILFLFVYFLLFPNKNQNLYFLAFWICLVDIFFPIWFFQGIEKMKFISIISITSKIINLLLVFILIKDNSDILLFYIINILTTLVSGFLSYFLIKKESVYFYLPNLSIIKKALSSAYMFFLQGAITITYVITNKFFIGYFLGMQAMAYYDLAEKIVSLFRIPQTILSQIAFPKIVFSKNKNLLRKIFNISFLINCSIYFIFIVILGKNIVLILGGSNMISSLEILYLLGLLIPISAIANVLGDLGLCSFGFNKTFTKTAVIGICSYFFVFMFVYFNKQGSIILTDICYSFLIAETIKAISCLYFGYKNKIYSIFYV